MLTRVEYKKGKRIKNLQFIAIYEFDIYEFTIFVNYELATALKRLFHGTQRIQYDQKSS